MNSTLIPKPSDDPHDVVVVPADAVGVAPSDAELSELLHQAARHRPSAQSDVTSDVPDRQMGPPVDTTFRPAAVNDNLVRGEPFSLVGRAVRAVMALLLAVCIGLAAFAWRAYGDTAEKKIAKWVTQFVLTASPPAKKPAPAAQQAAATVHEADAANTAPAQPAAPSPSAPVATAPAPGSPQLLQSMSRDLASLGQEVEQLKASIEQLKAGQQQMSREVAKASELKASEIKTSEQGLRPRISALPPRPAATRQHRPIAPSPPPQAAAVVPPPPAPYVPRQVEAPRPPIAATLGDPELSSVPRPPMPVR